MAADPGIVPLGEPAVEDIAEAIMALKRVGWLIGDAALVDASGNRC
jgi:hypothetical protein